MKKQLNIEQLKKFILKESAKLRESTFKGKDATFVKGNMPGFIGADFAKKASDDDIIKMAELKDKFSNLYNQHMKDIQIEINLLRKKYKLPN